MALRPEDVGSLPRPVITSRELIEMGRKVRPNVLNIYGRQGPPVPSKEPEQVEPTTETKPLLQSKTLWLNVIAIPFMIGGTQALIKAFDQGELPSEMLKYAPILVPLLNIALRFWTTAPVSFKNITGPLLLLAFLGLAGNADAATPKVVCNAPVFAISGEDVFVDLRKSTGDVDRYKLIIKPELSGLKQLEEIEPGYYRLYSYVGVFTLRCIVSNLTDMAEHEQAIYIRSHFPEPPTPPEPGPGPNPGPKPPGPQPLPGPDVPPTPPGPGPTPPTPPVPKPELPIDGEYKTARFVYDNCIKTKDPAGCTKAADVLGSLGSKVAAGGVTGVKPLVAELHLRFKSDIAQSEEWKAAWQEIMGRFTECYQENAAGLLEVENDTAWTMKNRGAWQDLLKEAERGARAASLVPVKATP